MDIILLTICGVLSFMVARFTDKSANYSSVNGMDALYFGIRGAEIARANK